MCGSFRHAMFWLWLAIGLVISFPKKSSDLNICPQRFIKYSFLFTKLLHQICQIFYLCVEASSSPSQKESLDDELEISLGWVHPFRISERWHRRFWTSTLGRHMDKLLDRTRLNEVDTERCTAIAMVETSSGTATASECEVEPRLLAVSSFTTTVVWLPARD